MSRGKESVQESEESRSMFGMKEVVIEEGVQFVIKLRVVEIPFLNQVEEPRKGQQRGSSSKVVRVGQKVHQ
jgi:hypothetical protein